MEVIAPLRIRPCQVGQSSRKPVALIGAQRTPKLVLSGPQIRSGPSPTLILGMVVEPDPNMPKWNKRLKYPGALHERRVAKAADRFKRKRLLPLPHSDGSQRSSVLEVPPEICESRTTEKRKVHLHEVVHAIAQRAFGTESGAAKIGSAFDSSVGESTRLVLLEGNPIGLEYPAELNARKFLFCQRCKFQRCRSTRRANRLGQSHFE